MNTATSTTTGELFSIGAPGFDVGKLVADLQAVVDRKMADGVYADAKIARAERTNLIHLRDSDDFVTFYLTCLRDAVYVDISDFEIREQRRHFAGPLIKLKKAIWKLLKFYTFRLWSQQNQVNGLLITALESMEEQYSARLAAQEKRIAALEAALAAKGAPGGQADG